MPGCCWEAAERAWWFGQQPGAALIILNSISSSAEFVVKSAELLLI